MAPLYVLPDLPYDCSALEPVISGRIIELHHDKHHAAYVKAANETLEKLAEARAKERFETIAQLEKALAFNVSGHVLHSVYWTNLAPDGGGRPMGALGAVLDREFGGVEAFAAQMTEAASTLQGSGWALASWEPLGRRIVVQQVYDHQGNHGQGTIPLLALDGWEHAYYLQYENRKGEYFDALWSIVNWYDVARRFEAANVDELVPTG